MMQNSVYSIALTSSNDVTRIFCFRNMPWYDRWVNKPLRLQRYNKKSECANKIYFILPFAGFCERNFGGNVVAESEGTFFLRYTQEFPVFFAKKPKKSGPKGV